MDIPILYEDSDLVVINKPSGLVVNRAESVKGETVQDWVEQKFLVRSSKFIEHKDTDFGRRSGTVHRIDKETSGALIVAKTESAFIKLQRQFKERLVQKTYQALVHGTVSPAQGAIKAPVGRLPWNRKRFGVFPGGKEAETRYQVEDYYSKEGRSLQGPSLEAQKYSFVLFFPKSGRTHQIRAHAKHIGHPIVADSFYAGKRGLKEDRQWCSRLFLHAASITFTQPTSNKQISVTAGLPKDLQSAIDSLDPVDK